MTKQEIHQHGMMRRVRIGSPSGEIRVAHWRFSQWATDDGDEYSCWQIHGHGKFTIDEDDVHTIEQPLNFSNFEEQVRRGEAPVFAAMDHPRDAGKTHPALVARVLKLKHDATHPSGLPIWREPGDDGRSFLYHSGYDQLIPLDEFNSWQERWESWEFDGKRD